jgi:hypothetical protein
MKRASKDFSVGFCKNTAIHALYALEYQNAG